MPTDAHLAYVVDDDGAVRRSLVLLLRSAGFEAMAYESGGAFLRAAEQGLRFGCVLLDLRMPGMDGLAVQREMVARDLGFPVVTITAHGDVPLAIEAMRAGACDFIEKPYEAETIIQATEAALARGNEARARAHQAADAAARVAALAPREMEVLRGLVAGRQSKVIAPDLGISLRTVEIYRASLMDKLGARSLPEVVRVALAGGVRPAAALPREGKLSRS